MILKDTQDSYEYLYLFKAVLLLQQPQKLDIYLGSAKRYALLFDDG